MAVTALTQRGLLRQIWREIQLLITPALAHTRIICSRRRRTQLWPVVRVTRYPPTSIPPGTSTARCQPRSHSVAWLMRVVALPLMTHSRISVVVATATGALSQFGRHRAILQQHVAVATVCHR